jgi:hypothetical protein
MKNFWRSGRTAKLRLVLPSETGYGINYPNQWKEMFIENGLFMAFLLSKSEVFSNLNRCEHLIVLCSKKAS